MISKRPFLGLAWAAVPFVIAWQPTAAQSPEQRSGTIDDDLTTVQEQLDDAIPLPVDAEVQAGPDGDVVVSPASGDPFFVGFVAGAHYPPAGERIDPRLLAQLQTSYADGRPSAHSFAFVMFEKRITPARIEQLTDLGCRVLQFHPHYTLKVAVPVGAVEAVAALDFVHWIGVAQPWQKVHTHLTGQLASAPANRPLEVYVSVFESDLNPASTSRSVGTVETVDPGAQPVAGDPAAVGQVWMSNGWQQRELERRGLEVTEYVDRIRAFRARMLPSALESVVALDFVQFVESDVVDHPMHDESTPAALSDYVRQTYDGGTNLVAIAGEIDSGIESAHTMLNHVFYVGWNYATVSAFDDGCGHGSHVAGTILGLPATADAGLTGNAPGLGSADTLRVRNVRRFDDVCVSTGTSHSTLYSHMRADYVDGGGATSAKPHAINNSWGSDPSTPWVGTEANAVTLDAEVWDYSQLYVFSAGNAGSGAGTIGLPAVAKNCFTVGSVIDFRDATDGDPGQLRNSSSRGPCGDNRWKPNICAPGTWIRSADAGDLNGYTNKSGTSMAAPHITGIAATLADHYSAFRYAPHRTASLLMATAMTNNDVLLTNESDTHLDEFGAGRVNAARAHYALGDSSWTNSGFTLSSGSSTFDDFTVPSGATRLVVCMTYHEIEPSTGASDALVNDLDLWIDRDPIDTANNNTGEYSAQQSSVDNTEIRIIDNPAAGPWRWKVYSDSTTSSSRVSVTFSIIDGDTTPDGTLNVVANDTFVQPSDDVTITATATTPSYFGSFVFLDSTSSGDSLQSSSTTLFDGLVTDLLTNQHAGRDVLLGTIYPGSGDRVATWVTRWATEGVKSWSVNARSDNWVDKTDAVNVTVDGTLPGLVTNLTSSTHTIATWTNDDSITYIWTAAPDNLSGIDGYGIFSTTSAAAPSNFKDIEQVTSYAEVLPDGTRYFNIKAVDNCGNWDDAFATTGPYFIDTVVPTGPGAVSSSTHTVNVQSCNTTVLVNWTAASDALSGLDGYVSVWNTSPVFDPVGASNLGPATTSQAVNIGSSTSARYYHVRARDEAGNYGTTQHFGPVFANAASVSTYCTAKTNSLGCLPAIGSVGQPDKSAGTFQVTCTNVLNQKNALMFWGYTPSAVVFQGGIKCVASPTIRGPSMNSGGSALPANDCTGSYAFTWTTAYMNTYSIDPGDTIFAQWWTRDPGSPSTTGLSNGIRFTVCE